MRRDTGADPTVLGGAQERSAPRSVARHAGRSSALLVALSVVGLGAWAALSLLATGAVNLPGSQAISSASSGWRSWATSATSASTTTGATNVTGHIRGALQPLNPMACSSAGENVVGANLTIPATEVVCGAVLVTGGNLNIAGEVRGSVQEIGGNTVISGIVTGDVTVIGGDLTVRPGATISGATHDVGGTITVDSGVRLVRGTDPNLLTPTDTAHAPGLNFNVDAGSFWLGLLFWMSATLGLCVVAPEMVGRVRYTISRHAALSGLMGVVFGLIALIVAMVLIFTCIGIPLALLLAVAVWFGWVVGTVGLGAWIGSIIFGGPRHTPSLVISSLLGVVVLTLLKEAPFAGPVITWLAGAIALGGATLTFLSARRAPYAVYKR